MIKHDPASKNTSIYEKIRRQQLQKKEEFKRIDEELSSPNELSSKVYSSIGNLVASKH